MQCALGSKKCKPCEGGVPPLDAAQIEENMKSLPDWQCGNNVISRTYTFPDYYRTMAFVNMIAWIAHSEDHHPDLSVSYNRCKVEYSTHAIGGLSENDFICAAKVDQAFSS